jgi:hypothetical protein
MQDVAKQPLSQDMLSDFKSASDEQLKSLGAAEQDAEKKISQTLEDMAPMQELLKDFNQFQQLFEAQQALTEQARAFNRNANLSREDQLALRDMATTEKDIENQLRDLSDKLREDAKKAEEKFPKAAKSGRDLAEKIEEQRMPPLANDATSAMLNGQGEKSYDRSEKLRSEMEKLFGQCQSQGQNQSDELDSYLKLQKQMRPGNTFKQMMQSRKFGGGKNSPGQAQGQGPSGQGKSGYVIMNAPAVDVLGNETRILQGNAKASPSNKVGVGQGTTANEMSPVQIEKSGALTGLKSVNRKSDAVNAESPLDEYDDLVDKYFKTITK